MLQKRIYLKRAEKSKWKKYYILCKGWNEEKILKRIWSNYGSIRKKAWNFGSC